MLPAYTHHPGQDPASLLLLGEPRALLGVPWPSSSSHSYELQDSELARTPRTRGVQLYLLLFTLPQSNTENF